MCMDKKVTKWIVDIFQGWILILTFPPFIFFADHHALIYWSLVSVQLTEKNQNHAQNYRKRKIVQLSVEESIYNLKRHCS